jgi:hypothetical protein
LAEISVTIEVAWAAAMIETRAGNLVKIRAMLETKGHLIISAAIWAALILRTIIEVRMIGKEVTRAFLAKEMLVMITALLLLLRKFSLEALITVSQRMSLESILNKSLGLLKQLKL